jgi:hypothetical protein
LTLYKKVLYICPLIWFNRPQSHSMKKRLNVIRIFKAGTCDSPVSFKHKLGNFSNGVAFFFYRVSLSIHPTLIISRVKQRLMSQPSDSITTQSCSVLQVTTGTAYSLGKVMDGSIAGRIWWLTSVTD